MSLCLEKYSLPVTEDGHHNTHTVIHISNTSQEVRKDVGTTYNILMADVSGSMVAWWPVVILNWNKHIAPSLSGKTEIYTFGKTVTFCREEAFLEGRDLNGSTTNLTLALSVVLERILACKEKDIRAFLITDGNHNDGGTDPQSIVKSMVVPEGKTCEFYLWAIGNSFPVRLSIEIRSRLHNGSANMPTLFWSKVKDDMEQQTMDMAAHLMEAKMSVKLSLPGCLVPGLPDTHNFHQGEWVYMACDPSTLDSVHVSIEGHEPTLVPVESCPFDVSVFLDSLMPQWNSVLIQMHNLKKDIPKTIFPFMEELFQVLYDKLAEGTETSNCILGRLSRKMVKSNKVQFQTLFKQSKTILTSEKYMNEIDLAEAVLLTTVTTRKHALKGLQLKGHTEEDYAKDCEAFMGIYTKVKEQLKSLNVTPEDSCRVTLTSTIGDFKDDFFPELLKLNKFEFLKTLSISGIPVYSHSRDSTELNPWSFKVDRILASPFSILSQVAMEEFAGVGSHPLDLKDKLVLLQQNNEDSGFNAVVPVFPPKVVEHMQPLVRTNLYAMCATFALLKNPHIIEYNIHLASLGATWVKTLSDFPVASERPEYIQERLEMVEATGTIYLDRPSLVLYMKELLATPHCALMSECPREDPEAKPLRCEAIVKPLFLMRLTLRVGHPINHEAKVNIVRLAAVEFAGRCLTCIAHEKLCFTKTFMEELAEEKNRNECLHEMFQEFIKTVLDFDGSLLSKFYYPELIEIYVAKLWRSRSKSLRETLSKHLDPKARGMEKLYSLHNCGDMTWKRLQVCAIELGLSNAEVKEIFSEKNALIYGYHALSHTTSRERMGSNIADYDTCVKMVKTRVAQELIGCSRRMIQEEIQVILLKQWYQEFDSCHGSNLVIQPMIREDIVREAREHGIDVTLETFSSVFPSYNEKLGLLRNACQAPGCPYYLHPNCSFNQHVKSERRLGKFLHRLHIVASGEEDIATKVDLLKSFDSNINRVTPELLVLYQHKLEILSSLYHR